MVCLYNTSTILINLFYFKAENHKKFCLVLFRFVFLISTEYITRPSGLFIHDYTCPREYQRHRQW